MEEEEEVKNMEKKRVKEEAAEDEKKKGEEEKRKNLDVFAGVSRSAAHTVTSHGEGRSIAVSIMVSLKSVLLLGPPSGGAQDAFIIRQSTHRSAGSRSGHTQCARCPHLASKFVSYEWEEGGVGGGGEVMQREEERGRRERERRGDTANGFNHRDFVHIVFSSVFCCLFVVSDGQTEIEP